MGEKALILPRLPRAFGTVVDMRAREKSIGDRLADGRLPKTRPVASRAAFGNGRLCDGCGGPVLSPEVEQEHDLRGGGTLHFHATCAQIWERMTASAP